MASLCLPTSISLSLTSPSASNSSFSSTSASPSCSFSASPNPLRFHKPLLFLLPTQRFASSGNRRLAHIVRMAPEEEKMTRRSPLDFPIEWERPKPARRADIFPQFSPMKTPLPPPMPADPPEEDEEEEEEKQEEEVEEDPEKEDKPETPEGS